MFLPSPHRAASRPIGALLWIAIPLLALAGCDETSESGTDEPTDEPALQRDVVQRDVEPRDGGAGLPATSLVDAELESWRRDLLIAAFDNASKFPIEPHLKNRSRLQQEGVIAHCIELDQLALALDFSSRVDNWRRGLAIAEVVEKAVRNGVRDGLDPLIDRATDIAFGLTQDDHEQPWRRDRIRSKLAEACIQLGRVEQVTELEFDLDPSEKGKSDIALARIATVDEVQLLLDQLDGILELRDFDRTLNSLPSICVLYARFFDDEDVRRRIGGQIRGWIESKANPAQASLDGALQLARVCADRGATDLASSWLDLAQETFDSVQWNLHLGLAQQARIAEERFRIGEDEVAKSLLSSGLKRFDDGIESVVDVWRSEPLCAVAQAYAVDGELATARTVYQRALEQAVANPNSRPRAEDLVRVAMSWARTPFRPDAELAARLEEKFSTLGEPW